MQSRTDCAAAPMVGAAGVHKRFGALHVLRGVDLTVARGEVVAVLGASGSGKSTLLRCLNHLETVDRGTIQIAGDTLVQDDGQGGVRYPPRRRGAPRVPPHRHGVPTLQPVPAPDGAAKPD